MSCVFALLFTSFVTVHVEPRFSEATSNTIVHTACVMSVSQCIRVCVLACAVVYMRSFVGATADSHSYFKSSQKPYF